MKQSLFLLTTLVLFFSCNKEENLPKGLFVEFNYKGNICLIEEGKNDFHDGSFNVGNYIGGSFVNINHLLRDPYFTPLNMFDVVFENIPFDSIKVGMYDFSNEECKKGVIITFMNENEWPGLIYEYKLSQNYQDCLEYYSSTGAAEEICTEYKMGKDDFFTTFAIQQEGSFFEITKTSIRKYNEQGQPEDAISSVDDMILEGKFFCKVQSRLKTDEDFVIDGRFRIHLPSKKFI